MPLNSSRTIERISNEDFVIKKKKELRKKKAFSRKFEKKSNSKWDKTFYCARTKKREQKVVLGVNEYPLRALCRMKSFLLYSLHSVFLLNKV